MIAIDGPLASGKGTLGRRLALELDFAYLDTGLLYRAVGSISLERGIDQSDSDGLTALAQAFDLDWLGRSDLREEKIGNRASVAAVIPELRTALYDLQRRFALTPKDGKAGAILDGRDIGTVILPDAPLKLFVTASVEVRAKRRFEELQARQDSCNYASVLDNLRRRDERDASRVSAPMKSATDAKIIDTSDLGAEQAYCVAWNLVAACFPDLDLNPKT